MSRGGQAAWWALLATTAVVLAAATASGPAGDTVAGGVVRAQVPGRPGVAAVAVWTATRVAPGAVAVPRAGAGGPGRAVPMSGGLSASTVGILVVDGGRHQCSASVVASPSHRVLATAAHCVWSGGQWTLEGSYFLPGSHDGSEPYGRWPVERAWVPSVWQTINSAPDQAASNHDVAFVRLASSADGQSAEDALGGEGVSFDAPQAATVTVLGYPVAPPFDGHQLERCTGAASTRELAAPPGHPQGGGPVLVVDCDMTEGASGGPWLVGPDAVSGAGQLVGVTSARTDDGRLLSMPFGHEACEVFVAADGRGQGGGAGDDGCSTAGGAGGGDTGAGDRGGGGQ